MAITLDATLDIPGGDGKGKFVKLDKGDNIFRFLDAPVIGYLWWDDNKVCTRVKTAAEAPDNVDLNYFWHFPVWMDDEVRYMEIKQKSVLKQIKSITESDPGYKDLGEYDIKVTGDGDGKDRRYTTVPLPIKPLSDEAVQAWEADKEFWEPEKVFESGTEVTSENDDGLPF